MSGSFGLLRAATLAVALSSACAATESVQRCDPAASGECPSGSVCARQSGEWAQCVSCDAEQFADACPYWQANLTAAAEAACSLTCLGHRGNQCYSIDCNANTTCVHETDTWSQCVDCGDAAFQEDCGYWSGDFRSKAEAACNQTCHAGTRLL